MHGGQLEVRLEDATRVDLLTDTHAIEIEHAQNWKEAIGQALHYARLTDNKPGSSWSWRGRSAPKHLEHLRAVIAHYRLPIDVFTTEKGD